MICPYFSEPQYLFYVSDLPGVFYYAYVPAILTAILIGALAMWSDRKELLNRLLFGICLAFLAWTFGTLITWTNIHSSVILFAWSLLFPAASFISVLSIYFTYVFIKKHDIGLKMKLVFAALLLPQLILAPTYYSLSGFNLTNCDAFGFEGLINTVYPHVLAVLAMIWIFSLLVFTYRKAGSSLKKQIIIMGTGIELFPLSFFVTGFLGQYLTTIGFLPDSSIETYGYFGMIIFAVYIGILVVRFKILHVNMIASQALIFALLVLIGAQFSFIRDATNILLNAIALFLTAVIGFILIRSVRREILQREHIEMLAKDLELANKQQVTLIHFITHQLKGFVAKSRNIFAMIQEGDYGPVPSTMKPMIDEGFASSTKGAQTIQDILNAANIKSGAVAYQMLPFDFKELVDGIVGSLKAHADEKGVALTLEEPAGPLMFTGDRMQMENAIKNMVDNTIKYTQQGSIKVSLERVGPTIRFMTKDTGVGITKEDMAHLFTEGGHGAESQKVNVESTGFGLYIVKNIIEAHKGKVWAESEGAGKGSTFIVELPLASEVKAA